MSPFRAQRLLVSSGSFRPSWLRRAWTWPAMQLGRTVGWAGRRLERLLGVDPRSPRERREYVAGVVADDYGFVVDGNGDRLEIDYDEDDDDGEASERYYRNIPIPLTRREQITHPIARAARWLGGARQRWQDSQLALVMICDIRIGQLSMSGAIPAEMFSLKAFDTYAMFPPAQAGMEIAVQVNNGSAHTCHLLMAMMGTPG